MTPTIRLAPLAGVTDWTFRTLCFEQGCDCAYTEMVSAKGWVYAPKQEATQSLLLRTPGDKKLILQLFGKEPDMIARASEALSADGTYDGIDLNMGCPAPKIAGNGEGSGLMKTPELAGQIMRETVRASHLPVTVKCRLGWDPEHINVLDFAKMAEDSGVSAICIHGRTRTQMYTGEADWDLIARAVQTVSIPVYGNGDIFTAEDAVRRIRESGVQGILIGRGAMGDPWLFRRIKDALNGRTPEYPTNAERLQMILRHYNMMLSWRSQRIAVCEMRKHIAWYLKGVRGAAQLRVKINSLTDPDEVKDTLRTFLLSAEDRSQTEVNPE